MNDGFLKVCACTPEVTVADTEANEKEILRVIEAALYAGAKLIVLPELCVTGYTCQDLFFQESLLRSAKETVIRIAKRTEQADALIVLGAPLLRGNKLYNTAVFLCHGKILGVVPKIFLPNYGEFYELRHFTPAPEENEVIRLGGEDVPFGKKLLFRCENFPAMTVAAEICEDLWAPLPPSTEAALRGATLIVNPSASDELTGKAGYRKELVRMQSARCFCAGTGESTQDLVFGAHNMIAENGVLLAEAKRFKNEAALSEIDLFRLLAERRRNNTFLRGNEDYEVIPFMLEIRKVALTRKIDPRPFIPAQEDARAARCEEILNIQAAGLYKRLQHVHAKRAVVGISGGLDSTLALLVTARAFDLAGLDRKGILAVTMPGFGTTDRTHDNARALIDALGADFLEVDIRAAVQQHFRDIGQDENNHDVTYENSQARERTQILMDLANRENAFVVGTGDLSELALGWATYNGDHMSMYGVNGGVPKTLVRHLVHYTAQSCNDPELSKVLLDICETPVSPELLPPKEGVISQKTEELVGPYELHDFFLYYLLRFGFSPKKIFRLAKEAFADEFTEREILSWLKTFFRRFFSQQYKRSCLPDGPKVGSVAISPRGDLRMPSDASAALFLKELEAL